MNNHSCLMNVFVIYLLYIYIYIYKRGFQYFNWTFLWFKNTLINES